MDGKQAYRRYLKSEKWRHLRSEALCRSGYKCQVCNAAHPLDVHHRTYPKVWGREPVSDLIVLCNSCHKMFHEKNGAVKRERNWQPVLRVVVFENGKVQHMTKTRPEFARIKESPEVKAVYTLKTYRAITGIKEQITSNVKTLGTTKAGP